MIWLRVIADVTDTDVIDQIDPLVLGDDNKPYTSTEVALEQEVVLDFIATREERLEAILGPREL